MQAIHNGFSNTTGLIMLQLVNPKYERKKGRPNEGSVLINGGGRGAEKWEDENG